VTIVAFKPAPIGRAHSVAGDGERRLDIAPLHSAPFPIDQLFDVIFCPSSMNARDDDNGHLNDNATALRCGSMSGSRHVGQHFAMFDPGKGRTANQSVTASGPA
jgi:hypothetical protein